MSLLGVSTRLKVTIFVWANIWGLKRWVVISDIANLGWIDRAAGNTLWPVMLFQYSRLSEPVPLPMVQGEFVNEDDDE
jgi:hypothetical protein